MSSILITGGLGFIGTSCAEFFKKNLMLQLLTITEEVFLQI